MHSLNILPCTKFLVILSWADIISECATMDFSIDLAAPVPKFKSIYLTGGAENLTSYVGVVLVILLIVDCPIFAM